jgi:hypothetical protein
MNRARPAVSMLPGRYAICRMSAKAAVPEWAQGDFVSVTRTADELSIVCPEDKVPKRVKSDPGWCRLKVAGPLDLVLVGVLASLLQPLAEAGVPVFVISTFDTDYVLVREKDLDRAMAVL